MSLRVCYDLYNAFVLNKTKSGGDKNKKKGRESVPLPFVKLRYYFIYL